jgi:6-pyruvoyltetrahydropterin/6-carboxytetrahydropterin synthase
LITLTRRYRFPAAHVLAREDFTPEANEHTYGKCANPGGHGHDYTVEVTVTGPVEDCTGEVMSRERLDDIVDERVLRRFGHRLLNEDELFQDCVPTAENLAHAIYQRLEAPVADGGSARLLRVRLHETRKNSFLVGELT